MDKVLIRQRFSKATHSYLNAADIQRQTALHLSHLLQKEIKEPELLKALEVGCGTGLFTRLILKHFKIQQLWLNDICPEVKEELTDCLTENVHFIPGDAEHILFPNRLDMIVSCSVLQWFEQPQTFITKCANQLRSNGTLAIAVYGNHNLQEITAITGKSLQYYSLTEWETMLKRDFNIIHIEEKLKSLYFSSPLEVLKHFKKTGVSGLSRQQWNKKQLVDFCNSYQTKFETANGKIPVTYHPLFIIGRKKL